MKYTYRNGETEPPTEEGYYWFNDEEDIGFGTLYVQDGFAYDTFSDCFLLEELHGRWWGPIVPPWQDSVDSHGG